MTRQNVKLPKRFPDPPGTKSYENRAFLLTTALNANVRPKHSDRIAVAGRRLGVESAPPPVHAQAAPPSPKQQTAGAGRASSATKRTSEKPTSHKARWASKQQYAAAESRYTIFLPRQAASSRSSATSSRNWAGVSCWGPSDRATGGFGCTSIMSESAI